MEKRGGGKKSGPNTVHGALQKFSDLRPIQQNLRKLMMEDGQIPYGNPNRTSLNLNQQGIANPVHTFELGENENLSPQNRSLGVDESGQLGCNEAHGQSVELDVDRNHPRICKIGADLEMENDEAVLMNMKKGGEVRGIPDLENTTVKRRSGGTLRMAAGEDLEMTEVDTGPDVLRYGEKVVTDARENSAQYTDDTDCFEKDFPRLGTPTHRTVGAPPEAYSRSQRRGRTMAKPPLAGYPSTRGNYKRRDFSSRRSRGPAGLREMENGMHSDWVGNGSRFADQTGRNGMWQEKGSGNVVQQERTFASLLNSNPMEKSMKLYYVEPGLKGEKPVFCPKESDILEAKKKWEAYLVGYFISGSLTTSSVERIAKGYWGKLGLGKVLADSSGFYFFQIPDDSVRMKILEEGPWLFYGRNMVLQQWSPELVLCKHSHDKIPLWVRFHKVPLALWTAGGLSGIASLIGKPLYADSYMENMTKIDFARICVEVDAKRPLPESIQVCIRGNTFDIPVDYQWKPVRCPKCEAFGHFCKEEQEAT